jgi:hypothetical protein
VKNWKWLMVGAACSQFLFACAPEVMVAEDDEAGGAAGARTTGDAGSGGTGAGTGGSSGGAPQGGGGSASVSCPCSRRAEAPISMDCPRGSDQTSTATVGPDGANVVLTGTRQTRGVPFKLEIFPGSLDDETEIGLVELAASPPSGFVDWSPIYAVEPAGIDFVQGAAIQIPAYSSLTMLDRAIAIYFSESADGPFEKLTDSYVNAGFLQATALKTGFYFVGYPAAGEGSCP